MSALYCITHLKKNVQGISVLQEEMRELLKEDKRVKKRPGN